MKISKGRQMSTEWYCPNCGPVSNARQNDTDHMTWWNCPHCPKVVTRDAPAFVIEMQELIEGYGVGVKHLHEEIDVFMKRIDELNTIIEAAPHDVRCDAWRLTGVVQDYQKCTCWKSKTTKENGDVDALCEAGYPGEQV